jgi:putative Ca2+/H+ antiporter (TMEM165/GDT1 family)
MSALLITAGVVFLAELGDKTQLIAMAFVAKFGVWQVLAGASAAIVVNSALAVILGTGLGRLVPSSLLQLVAGIGFLGFGLWSLYCGEEDCDEVRTRGRSPFLTVFIAFFVAELGDKTQLVTMGLAVQQETPVLTFLGASIGLIAAGALGIFLSKMIAKLIPPRTMKMGAAAVFFTFGSLSLYRNLPAKVVTPPSIALYFAGLLALSYLVFERRQTDR